MKIKVIKILGQRQTGKTTRAIKYIKGHTIWLAKTAFMVKYVKDKFFVLSNDNVMVLNGGRPENISKLNIDVRKTFVTLIVDDYDNQPSLIKHIPYLHSVHHLFPNVTKVVFTETKMINKIEQYEEEMEHEIK